MRDYDRTKTLLPVSILSMSNGQRFKNQKPPYLIVWLGSSCLFGTLAPPRCPPAWHHLHPSAMDDDEVINIGIMQRMSDVRNDKASCYEDLWSENDGKCYLASNWQAVAAAGILVKANFFRADPLPHLPTLYHACACAYVCMSTMCIVLLPALTHTHITHHTSLLRCYCIIALVTQLPPF
jgi:hypothetical protein